MSKYDMNSSLTENLKLTISELCEELNDEYIELLDKNIVEKETLSKEGFKKIFKNNNTFGLIDRLKSKLNFDIEVISKKNNQNKFEMLQLLKSLYYIERFGVISYSEVKSDFKGLPIIDILMKPRLSNITTTYSNISVYGDFFDRLIETLKPHIKDVENRINRIAKMEAVWGKVLEKQYDYVTSDKALCNHKNAEKELDRMNVFLKEKILVKLSYVKPEQQANTMFADGVLSTFFNILQLNRSLCFAYDWAQINSSAKFDNTPSDKYCQLFLEFENQTYDRTFITQVEKSLKDEPFDEEVAFVKNFISYFTPIPDHEVKDYKYAFKHLETVLFWLEHEKKGFDFSSRIPLCILATIIQEIVHQKKIQDKITNDYVGYNNKNKSLISALKKKNNVDSVLIAAWMTQLENRFAINYGSHALIKKKRELENHIFNIQYKVFSYNNLDDVEKVNEFILSFIIRNLYSDEGALYNSHKMIEIISNNLQGKAKQISRILFDWNRVFNAFKDLPADPDSEYLFEAVSKDIAKQINSFYNELPVDNIETIMKYMRTDFSIYRSESVSTNHVLIYSVDKEKNEVEFREYIDYFDDDKLAYLNDLGLSKFIKF